MRRQPLPRRRSPGELDNPFDRLIIAWERLERLPAPLLLLLLLGADLLAARLQSGPALALLGFNLADWALLSTLPRLGVSHGPPKPQVVLLALLRLPFALLPSPWIWLAQGTGSLLALYAFALEPRRPRLSRQRLAWPALAGHAPLRLLHLGDLHLEHLGVRERSALSLIAAQRPDLILFSGDALSYSRLQDPAAHAQARWFFSKLRAPLGAFAVPGTPAVDAPHLLPSLFAGSPVRLLVDERVRLPFGGQTLHLIGLACTHRPREDGARLKGLLPPSGRGLTILLYHSPDLAPLAAELGVDLILTGHTHGGQVRLPLLGALYTASIYGRRFSAGRYRLGASTLYVTRGLGMEGKGAPRARFLCPPEVVLWEIGPPPTAA